MAKAKKKVAFEENEFLKSLINEVKAYEENSVVEDTDESSSTFSAILAPRIDDSESKRAQGIFGPDEDEESKVSNKKSKEPETSTAFKILDESLEKGVRPIQLVREGVPPRKDKHESTAEFIVPENSENDLDSLQDDDAIMIENASTSLEPAIAPTEFSPNRDKEAAPHPMIHLVGKSEEPQPLNQPNKATESTVATSEGATKTVASHQEASRTIVVEGARRNAKPQSQQDKLVVNSGKGARKNVVYTNLDASLAQAETLKLAQARIKELEHECDRLRNENDDLASASDVVSRRIEELQTRISKLQKERNEIVGQAKSEQLILKGHLQYKDTEIAKAKNKIEELEMRLKSDFRKIRVRERELENRLELVRAEKQALMRSKDEKILDLQRKLDQFKSELDLYRAKVQDLNKSMEEQQDQMKKTVRALRIALSNLEEDELTKILVGELGDGNADEVADSSEPVQENSPFRAESSDDEDPNKQNAS